MSIKSRTVWVLAPYGHRMNIHGVFSSYEEAVESLNDDCDEEYEFDDSDWYLEEFTIE